MENATKALIIAGAILVAILLVTMGISLLGNTNSLQQQQDQQYNALDVNTFNGRLTPAEGSSVLGSKVQTVVENIYLMFIDNPDTELTVKYGEDTAAGSTVTATTTAEPKTAAGMKALKAKIKTNNRYQVKLSKDDTTGYINEMEIIKLK